MWGIVPCTNGILGEAERTISKLNDHPLFEGMLVCHSLTLIDSALCGDPLDVKVTPITIYNNCNYVKEIFGSKDH